MTKEFIASEFQKLQDRICSGLEKLDGKAAFIEDSWTREEGGGGRTRVIQQGDLLEKGGVAFSAVHGDVTDEMKKQLGLEGDSFFATGVSIVLHPFNPHVPIIHMNVRYFEISENVYWFGGGIDLTPHYVNEEFAVKFHSGLKKICDRYHPDFYPKFKEQADTYFYIPHRGESRGIGGVFYDHLTAENSGISKDKLLEMALDLGDHFVELYAEQASAFRMKPYSASELDWRNLRRGRYVEFNLVNDRGTKFGLHSGGRTESILMSLPANACWEYNKQLAANSKESETLAILKSKKKWLN